MNTSDSGLQPATQAQLILPDWHLGGDLTRLETEMQAKAAVGELVDRGEGPFDLATMQGWGKERVIRADVLRYLLATDDWLVGARGVQLRGVRIIGRLDLEGVTLRCPLRLADCYLDAEEPVCLIYATAYRLTLRRCHLAGLTGGSLSGREVDLGGSTLTGPLRLLDSDITGQLDCSGAKLTGKDDDGVALLADRMKAGGVFLDQVTAAGAVRLASADIAGQFSCSGAKLTGKDNDGIALVGESMRAGSVFLDDVTAAGGVRLLSADITGQLSCRGAKLTGKDNDGVALLADRMKVGGNVFLDQEFTAAGGVRLLGADITGQLNCRGAKLTSKDNNGYAVFADGMRVGGSVFLAEGFTADWTVRLVGADIAGQLNCRGAKLGGKDPYRLALAADRTTVGGNVVLDGGFTAAGTVRLRSVRIGGPVELRPAALADSSNVALDAAGAQITGELVWKPASPVVGRVDLEGATAGPLVDDWGEGRPGGFWPAGGQLRLDGFTYGRFAGDQQATVVQRLEWIRGQYWRSAAGWRGFVSQPYEQLANVYRQAGKDGDARDVAIARRADLRRYGSLTWYQRAGNWFLDKTIKFGYQTWRAALGLAVVFVAFLVLTLVAQQHHAIVPVNELVASVHPVPVATRCAPSYPCFYPLGYAVDVVIPVINVHQADFWGFHGWGWVVASWAATVLGWAAVTLLVVGYTGLVRQQ